MPTDTTPRPVRIAVLGTGAIGSAVARAMLHAGHDVTVWNRTASRTGPLERAGARVAATPATALAGSRLALLALSDYTAVREVVASLPPGQDGRSVLVLGPASAEEAVEAAEELARLRASYLCGGLQAGPDDIGTDAARIILSGARAAFERDRTVIDALGSVTFVGERPDAAARWDLALYGLWYDAQLGLLRAFDAVRSAGADLDLFARQAADQVSFVAASAAATAAELESGTYPRGPASLAEHLPVLERLVEARSGCPLGDGGLARAIRRVEELIAHGHDGEGLTALGAP